MLIFSSLTSWEKEPSLNSHKSNSTTIFSALAFSCRIFDSWTWFIILSVYLNELRNSQTPSNPIKRNNKYHKPGLAIKEPLYLLKKIVPKNETINKNMPRISLKDWLILAVEDW